MFSQSKTHNDMHGRARNVILDGWVQGTALQAWGGQNGKAAQGQVWQS